MGIYTYMYIYNGMYTYVCKIQWNITHKKNEILPLVTTRMDLDSIILSEISQPEKDKYCMISLICGI